MSRADFDLALKLGQGRERVIEKLLTNDSSTIEVITIEVKSEVLSEKYVFVEHEAWAKPSGIAITKADYYAIEVYPDWWVFIPTPYLRTMWRDALEEFGERRGGDDNAARGAIVPKEWLVYRPHCPNR